jgi:hypothetical protein
MFTDIGPIVDIRKTNNYIIISFLKQEHFKLALTMGKVYDDWVLVCQEGDIFQQRGRDKSEKKKFDLNSVLRDDPLNAQSPVYTPVKSSTKTTGEMDILPIGFERRNDSRQSRSIESPFRSSEKVESPFRTDERSSFRLQSPVTPFGFIEEKRSQSPVTPFGFSEEKRSQSRFRPNIASPLANSESPRNHNEQSFKQKSKGLNSAFFESSLYPTIVIEPKREKDCGEAVVKPLGILAQISDFIFGW